MFAFFFIVVLFAGVVVSARVVAGVVFFVVSVVLFVEVLFVKVLFVVSAVFLRRSLRTSKVESLVEISASSCFNFPNFRPTHEFLEDEPCIITALS